MEWTRVARKSEKLTREKADFYLHHWEDFLRKYGKDADLMCKEFQFVEISGPDDFDEDEKDTYNRGDKMWVAVYPEDLENHTEEDGSLDKEWKNFEVWYGR